MCSERESFAQRVRRLRTEHGLSLADLAKQVGIDRTYISKFERGVAQPPEHAIVVRLARALNVPVDYLDDLVEKPSKAELRQRVANLETQVTALREAMNNADWYLTQARRRLLDVVNTVDLDGYAEVELDKAAGDIEMAQRSMNKASTADRADAGEG